MLRLANRLLLLLLLLLLLPNGGGGGGGGGGGDWMANNMFLQKSLGKKSAVGGLFEAQQLGCAEDTPLSVLNRCLLGTESRNNFDSVAGGTWRYMHMLLKCESLACELRQEINASAFRARKKVACNTAGDALGRVSIF